ncbi:MAG: AmmeMemoRadiSam system radical SAM enzyme [Spirochaetales bacterium]|nr:AmmeMemoRadiSam system radical SAM enzyme [Spirochaetales bacterium]MCF7939757.1 AmmeMemoRadiSam system radical SAM enzyme [Spirochaetales bacterium]
MSEPEKVAEYYREKEDGVVQCVLCPNVCIIEPGETGECRIRLNSDGRLTLPFYGALSAVSTDPIEKKPLYHFYPASRLLSVGFYGCSFHCPFCQNYSISQSTPASPSSTSPEDVVNRALKEGSFAIAYTYSEPSIHFEYVRDTSKIAHEQGLKNVLVTNGYLSAKAAGELLQVTDAVNVDLKSFNEKFYNEEIGGKLKPVLNFIELAAELGVHLEVTTLVIPTKNDTEKEIDSIAEFLAEISPSIPLHLSAYYPTYKYTISPTPPSVLENLSKVAQKRLRYVYLGNVRSEVITRCPSCGNKLIRRTGFHVSLSGIDNVVCSQCGFPAEIVGIDKDY